MSDTAERVLRISMPLVRDLLRASPREWSVAEIAAHFGVIDRTVKQHMPRWVGMAANVRVHRTARGHIRGFQYDAPASGFEGQIGPTIDGLLARIAALEAEVACLKASSPPRS